MLEDLNLILSIIMIMLITIKALNVFYLLIEYIINYLNHNLCKNRWLNNNFTIEDLYRLTPNEFKLWCSNFLQKEGYYIVCNNTDENGYFVASKGETSFYVTCLKYDYKKKAKETVDIDICTQLIGNMVNNHIYSAIIITTGVITENAINYVKSLPSEYNVITFNGDEFITKYSLIINDIILN